MTTELKPIETHYDGYLFRSRLEARYAVFFDSLGIKYEYEKEGFDLGAAGWYLPDFFLPGYRCWVEIKGDEPTKEDFFKVQTLVLAGKVPAFLFRGLPRWGFDDISEEMNEEYGCEYYPKRLIVSGSYIEYKDLPEGYAEWVANDPDEYGGIDRVSTYLKYGRHPYGADIDALWSPFGGGWGGRRGDLSLAPHFSFSDDACKRAVNQARKARFERQN